MSDKLLTKVQEMFSNAILLSQNDKIEYLLKNIPEVIHAKMEGTHAILSARPDSWLPFLKIIHKHGLDLNMKMVSSSGIADFTFLHIAASFLDVAAVEYLFSVGVEFAEAAGGVSPFHCAVVAMRKYHEDLNKISGWVKSRRDTVCLLLKNKDVYKYVTDNTASIVNFVEVMGGEKYATELTRVIEKCGDPDYCFECHNSPCVCFNPEQDMVKCPHYGVVPPCPVVKRLANMVKEKSTVEESQRSDLDSNSQKTASPQDDTGTITHDSSTVSNDKKKNAK